MAEDARDDLRSGEFLRIDGRTFREKFDREPFGFAHGLSDLELFGPDSLRALAASYTDYPTEFFVSASAASADTPFDLVPHSQCGPAAALDRMDFGATRLLLKRPERRDPRFRRLLDTVFEQAMALRGGMHDERLVRLESAIFVTSAESTTPVHFDPEIGLFSQIEGEKIYHVYPPTTLGEAALEAFYIKGIVSIGQVDLSQCDPAHEMVFTLGPGRGLHQPQNSPHWVETRGSRSVSYTVVFETDMSRARGRARACNHYLRKMGISPTSPGIRPPIDAVKAGAMRLAIPIRRRVRAKLGMGH